MVTEKAKGTRSGAVVSASGPPAEVDGTLTQRSAVAGDYDHEEWLLDESLLETFPASDPIAPALPPEDATIPGPGSR